MQVKLQNLWYGNELSEYDTVQCTVLDGRVKKLPQLPLTQLPIANCHRLIAVSIGDIGEW